MIVSTVPEGLKKGGLYTVSETARLLGVARSTVYRMIEARVLSVRYRKVSGKPVITGESAIQAIIGVM